MDVTIPVTALCIGAMGLGVWELLKTGARDVLAAASLFEGALLATVGINLLLPNVFPIGALGALGLGWYRVSAALQSRVRAIKELPESSERKAEALLLLYDHGDRVRNRIDASFKGLLGWVSMAVVGLGSLGLIGAGLAYDTWPLMALGSIAGFLPFAAASNRIVQGAELHSIEEETLALLGGQEPGGLVEGGSETLKPPVG
jgi:hypothetical protein